MEKSIEILSELVKKTIIPHKCQNERYLHHYYSKKMQEYFKIDFEKLEMSELHPEWPTSKKSTNISFSKYRKNDEKKYIIDVDKGSAAFIDFVVGSYKEPEFAIEFVSKYDVDSEGLIFDFLKLLDSKNPFKYAISFNLIYRKNGLPQGRDEQNIINSLKATLDENMLKARGLKIAENRQFLFWLIEIDKNGNKRSWICDNIARGFEEKLPDFQK